MEKQIEKKKKKKKAQRWIKPRHTPIKWILQMTFGQYCKLRYRIKITPLSEKHERQYLVLYNHQTAYDQFFVGLAFKKPLYYIASEDIFSMGFLSKLIKFLVEPIPIKKQATDVRSMLNCMKVVKEGGSIALAPEGNRTYSGKTEYIKPSIVSLIRALKLPVAFYKLEGGYGVHPRWSDKVRRGRMKGGISRILEIDEINAMSDEELLSVVEREMYVNEGVVDGEYHTKYQAEYLERAIYVCPECGLSEFESEEDIISCKRCGLTVRYTPTKELVGVGRDFPFRFVTEWYEYQKKFVNEFDLLANTESAIYCDSARLSEVILYKNKRVISDDASISLFGDRIEVKYGDEELLLDFANTSSVAVLGKNKVNVYHKDRVYQFKGNERFCGLKYVNLYFRYKNLTSEVENEQFLGL